MAKQKRSKSRNQRKSNVTVSDFLETLFSDASVDEIDSMIGRLKLLRSELIKTGKLYKLLHWTK